MVPEAKHQSQTDFTQKNLQTYASIFEAVRNKNIIWMAHKL